MEIQRKNNVTFGAKLKVSDLSKSWNIQSKEWNNARQLAKKIGTDNDVISFQFGPQRSYSDTRLPLSDERLHFYDRYVSTSIKGKMDLNISTGAKEDVSEAPTNYHPVKYIEGELQKLIDKFSKKK